MKLENQVCSLELAKKLKGLGVNQKSLFVWTTLALYAHIPGVQEGPTPCVMPYLENENPNAISAFSVAELGEMLRKEISDNTETHFLACGWLSNGKVKCEYQGIESDLMFEVADSEADARAKMLICLIENGLVKPESLAA